jgi:fatty acid desaturase
MPQGEAKRLEWPSLGLCAVIYGGFITVTWYAGDLPGWAFVASAAILVAWHSSMQHEFIHGHPTRNQKINRALAFVPLSFWLPFDSYKRSHLRHHRDDHLTDPLDDPESYYWLPAQWQSLNGFERFVLRAHTTLAGRLLIGPAWNIGRYLGSEWQGLHAGDRVRRRIWGRHGVACLVLALWLFVVCRVDPLLYGLAVYAGTSLLLLRSFAEHRANEGVFERTAIVENSWVLGPLFLFNNLHAAHHERPRVPWYRLPRWYRDNRARLLADNGGLVYAGYGDVIRRYLLRPHDGVIHPHAVADLARHGKEALVTR